MTMGAGERYRWRKFVRGLDMELVPGTYPQIRIAPPIRAFRGLPSRGGGWVRAAPG